MVPFLNIFSIASTSDCMAKNLCIAQSSKRVRKEKIAKKKPEPVIKHALMYDDEFETDRGDNGLPDRIPLQKIPPILSAVDLHLYFPNENLTSHLPTILNSTFSLI